MHHMYDVPIDGTEHQIVLIENNKKKGSIENILKYTNISDRANTEFDVIADILHKDEHKVQHANLLDTAIKPLLEEMLSLNGFNSSTSRMILDAVMLKSTVPKKPTQTSTSSTYVSCPVPNCTFHVEIPKKVFHVLPKMDGLKNNLHFGEDYKLCFDTECSLFPMTRLWYVGRFLQDLKTHYEKCHMDLVDRNELPLLLESYIYFHFVLKRRGSPKSKMWRLKRSENEIANRVTSSYKKGHPPKIGDDEDYMHICLFIKQLV
eukprot:11397473-Ditylum_brightwellii.AAC.1